jgi:hypothetical protein
MNGSSMIGLSNQKFTETIGDDVIAREPRNRRDDGGDSPVLVSGDHARDGAARHLDRRGRSGQHGAARPFDVRAGRLGVHPLKRRRRQDDGRGALVRAEHLRQDARKRRGGGAGRRLVERRQGEGLPQHFLQARRLAVSDQPVLHGFSGRSGNPRRARPQRAQLGAERSRHAQDGQFIRPGERAPVEHAGEEMERRRQVGTLEPRSAPRPIDHGHGERPLNPDLLEGADLSQEVEGVRITAEQHVLTVVDDVARLAVGKRGRSSAEPATRLDDEHARAAPGEPHGSAQAGEAGADDGHVVLGQPGSSHCLSAISA